MSNKSLINQKIFSFSKYLQNSDLFKQIKAIAQNKSLQLSIIEIYFKHKSSNTQRHNSFLQTHILIHLKNDFSRFVTLNGSIGITKIIKKKTNKVDQQQNYTYFTLIDLPPTDKPSLKILRSLDFLTLLSQNKRWETRKFNEIAANDYRTTRSAFLSYLSNQTFNDLGVKIIQLSKTLSYPGYGWKRMRIEKNQNQFKTIKVGHLKKQSPHKRKDKKNKKSKTKSYSNPNLSGKKVSVSSKQKSENDKQKDKKNRKQKDKNNRKQKKKINKKESPESSESEELSQGSESEELPETEESEEKNLKEKSKKKENQKRKEKPKKKEQNEKKQSEKDKKKRKNKNKNKNKKDLPNKKEIVRINLFQNKQELITNPMLEINEFIKNFKENPPKNVETKKILIDFVNNITKSIMDSKQIKNIDCDKQLLFCKIFDYIYELILQEIHFQIITIIKERYNVDIDRQFRSTISNMNYIQLKHFQINKKYIDIKKLAMSSVWLEKINQVILPSKKLFIINSCVNYLLSSFKKKSDLENKKIFLLLSYIILHSKISNIKSNVKYIQIYQFSEQFEDTQTEINFKLFKLAIQFLENLKGEKLKNNQKPWRKYILKLKNIVIVQKKDVSENEKVQEIERGEGGEIERENEGGEEEEEENGEDIDENNVILNSPQNSNNNDKKKTQKSENSLEISKETENLNIITNKKKTQNSLHLKKSESVSNDPKQIQNKMNQNNKNEENDLISFEKDKDDGDDKEQIEINHKKEKKENKENENENENNEIKKNENENKNKNEKDENKESFQKNGNDEKDLASFVKDDNNHKVQENNDKTNYFNKNNENNQMKKKKMKINLEEISKQSEFGKFLKQDFQKLSLPEVYEFIEEYNKLYSEFIHLEKSVNLEKK
ncbi:heat shock transcription factor [Anaeramoeba flamelloides]|uniref:Heat shock transcription factor n=1 Tax=Anaeramoeba flamelloides TaxID=1746091 RepID=A0ABQ8XYR0_9EUKA|nr:heat shock transcription factor [Anaeramoeba flamelloides]